MSAYTPRDTGVISLVVIQLLATLLVGLAITRWRRVNLARVAAWMLVVGVTGSVERLCAGEPAGVRMLAIIGALLFGMKVVVTVEAQAAQPFRLTAWQWLAFAAGWFGMRPNIFRTLGHAPLANAKGLIVQGFTRMILGAVFVVLARLVWKESNGLLSPNMARTMATLLLLPGLSLMLHFGIFNIVAGCWRYAGVDCRPLFRAPLFAKSLNEFWSRRWNLAFSEMTALGIYRPLALLVDQRTALAVAFATSGLLHELAISVPVQAGYGLPFLYFVLHGLLVIVERITERRGWPVHERIWLGRAWTMGWLTLPLPILFTVPFLDGIVWPLIGM